MTVREDKEQRKDAQTTGPDELVVIKEDCFTL